MSGELCADDNGYSRYAVNCSGLNVSTTLLQVLWPDHCVINRSDALFHSDLTVLSTDVVVRKGYQCHASVSVLTVAIA